MILHGKHLVKAWTKQQSIVARTVTVQQKRRWEFIAKDLGGAVPIRLHFDSSAALSAINRTGLGKAKHIEIQHLWLQEAVRSGKLTVGKITTETNSSDLGTKRLTRERSEMLTRFLNCLYV